MTAAKEDLHLYSVAEYRLVSSLEEAALLLDKSPRNRIIGGGTFLRLGSPSIGTAIDLDRLGLDQVTEDGGFVAIGAMAPLRSLETVSCLKALAGGVLPKAVEHIVGVQFRSMATVGTSVFSRYGFSDVICAFLALDAEVELYRGGRMTLERFLESPRTRDILTRVYLPKDGRAAVYETLRGSHTDFGLVDVCIARRTAGRFAVSVGARPGVAKRCRAAEECLADGRTQDALDAIRNTMTYGGNMRAGAEYRRSMAAVLAQRALDRLKEALK